MSSKFLNLVLAILLSTCVVSQSKASLIVGEIYTDTETVALQWEYVGEFDLAEGPQFDNADGNGALAKALNGLQAASLLFGIDISQLALAAYADFGQTIDAATVGAAVVNHRAWYDSFWTGDDANNLRPAVGIKGEGITANVAGASDFYDAKGDFSAFVSDRAVPGERISYVFKAVSVPEPSMFAIFALAIFGFGVRRLKKS